MLGVCCIGLVHGLLIMLRYMAPVVPWETDSAHGTHTLHTWVEQLLALLDRAAAVAMPPLCHPKAGFPGDCLLAHPPGSSQLCKMRDE